jgi:vacuolar-type H+-ATPase subunit I/STV1
VTTFTSEVTVSTPEGTASTRGETSVEARAEATSVETTEATSVEAATEVTSVEATPVEAATEVTSVEATEESVETTEESVETTEESVEVTAEAESDILFADVTAGMEDEEALRGLNHDLTLVRMGSMKCVNGDELRIILSIQNNNECLTIRDACVLYSDLKEILGQFDTRAQILDEKGRVRNCKLFYTRSILIAVFAYLWFNAYPRFASAYAYA